MKTALRVTGIIALGIATLLGFADLQGWLTYTDRETFIEWVMRSGSGLSIDSLGAQAFLADFPSPPGTPVGEITHVTKNVLATQGGGIMSASINYMLRDQSRTKDVATLTDVRLWAEASRYPWLAWILGLVGFLEVFTSFLFGRL